VRATHPPPLQIAFNVKRYTESSNRYVFDSFSYKRCRTRAQRSVQQLSHDAKRDIASANMTHVSGFPVISSGYRSYSYWCMCVFGLKASVLQANR